MDIKPNLKSLANTGILALLFFLNKTVYGHNSCHQQTITSREDSIIVFQADPGMPLLHS